MESIKLVLGKEFVINDDNDKIKTISIRFSRKRTQKLQLTSNNLGPLLKESQSVNRANSAPKLNPGLHAKEISDDQDIADDMSIHINEELISDKLDHHLPSTRAVSVLKALNKEARKVEDVKVHIISEESKNDNRIESARDGLQELNDSVSDSQGQNFDQYEVDSPESNNIKEFSDGIEDVNKST